MALARGLRTEKNQSDTYLTQGGTLERSISLQHSRSIYRRGAVIRPDFSKADTPDPPCKTEPLGKPPLRWELLRRTFEAKGRSFTIEPIHSRDIDGIARLYRDHYPHLWGSSRQCFFDPSYYEKEVALAESWSRHCVERDTFMGKIQADDGELVFAFSVRKHPLNRSAQLLAMVLKPEHRGGFLGSRLGGYLDELIRSSGADYAFAQVAGRELLVQKLALRAGYKVGGVMPASVPRSYDGETYFRDVLVYMYRFYNGSEAYSTGHDAWGLPSRLLEAFTMMGQIADEPHVAER